MSEPSSLYEIEDKIKVRVDKKGDKKYKYYLAKMPEMWVIKVARDLGVNPDKLRLKMCFNEIHGLMVVPIKPPKNKPRLVENTELVRRLEE